MNRRLKHQQNKNQDITPPQLLSLLQLSYLNKKEHNTNLFKDIIKNVKENDFIKQNSEDDENKDLQIIYQNVRVMIQEGFKLAQQKKEYIPFQTMILHFDDTTKFQPIKRRNRICLDGNIRDSPIDYVYYIISKDLTNFQNLLLNESPIHEFTYQPREKTLKDLYIQQVVLEYPDDKETLYYYHQRDFYPIHLFTIFAKLKLS